MREASIPGNLKCVYTPHARVCEDNKLELEKNEILLKYFMVKGLTLKGCRRNVTLPIDMKIATRILHNTKVLLL